MKVFKPTSPGRRGMTGINFRELLSGDRPYKPLVKGVKRGFGRNNDGRITTRHKGSGAKRKSRDVSFDYLKKDIPARVETIEYDPNRTSFISLVVFNDGARQYRLAPRELKVGDEFTLSETAKAVPGNALPIGKIPAGVPIFNIEFQVGGGGKLARSAGESAEVIAQEEERTLVKLPSKETRYVSSRAWATVGSLSCEEYRFVTIGKAGRHRHMGVRPTVRGAAMNAVDHPHGGGEGKAPQGTKRPKNKWGKIRYGVKTRKAKKYSNKFIVSTRKQAKRK